MLTGLLATGAAQDTMKTGSTHSSYGLTRMSAATSSSRSIAYGPGIVVRAQGNQMTSPETPSVMVNGQPVIFDSNPFVTRGTLMIPLRGVFEKLGSKVVYDPATKQVFADGNGSSVVAKLGSAVAIVNGQSKFMDKPIWVIHDRAMVPMRFFVEALGAQTIWLPNSSTAYVQTQAQPNG